MKPITKKAKRNARKLFKRRTAHQREMAQQQRDERRERLDAETVARLLRLHCSAKRPHPIQGQIEYWQARRAGWDLTLAEFCRDHGGKITDAGMSEAWLWWLGIGWQSRMEVLEVGGRHEDEMFADEAVLRERYCETSEQLVKWGARSAA